VNKKREGRSFQSQTHPIKSNQIKSNQFNNKALTGWQWVFASTLLLHSDSVFKLLLEKLNCSNALNAIERCKHLR
jgi:aminopeptidase C